MGQGRSDKILGSGLSGSRLPDVFVNKITQKLTDFDEIFRICDGSLSGSSGSIKWIFRQITQKVMDGF